jgi:DNA repair photolyase
MVAFEFGVYSVDAPALHRLVNVRRSSPVRQTALFDDALARLPRLLPTLAQQGDITYIGVSARSVLNRPESTGMPYWSINPYVGCAFGCAYCYARYAHRYLTERNTERAARPVPSGDDVPAMPPWLAFERRIFVKRNVPDVVRASLRHGSARHAELARGETLVIGTATDPYQPAERHFRLTRGVLEALAEHEGLRVVIITKSALITRDVDVLTRLARHSRVTVHLSLITLDRDLARRLEPRAPTPDARLRALARLRDGGIDVGINIMPVLPGITDTPAGLRALVQRVAAGGATHVNAGVLRLQSEARKRYLPFIEAEFPHLAARYRATYAGSHDAGARYREGLQRVVRQLCTVYGIRCGRPEEDRARVPVPEESGDQLLLSLEPGGGPAAVPAAAVG